MVFVTKLFQNGLTDPHEILCLFSRSLSIFIQGDAQTGILRFSVDIFVYKWLLSVIGKIININ